MKEVIIIIINQKRTMSERIANIKPLCRVVKGATSRFVPLEKL